MWEKTKKWVFGLKSRILVFGSLKLRHPNNPQPPSSPPFDVEFKNNYVDGNRHGYWETYYGNGQLKYKGHFVNDKPHGYWEDYYANGKICSKGYYNGKRHGYWECYYWDNEIRIYI